jgi:hypothetical protein
VLYLEITLLKGIEFLDELSDHQLLNMILLMVSTFIVGEAPLLIFNC